MLKEGYRLLYLNQQHLNEIGINWRESVGCIEKAVKCMEKQDFAQPLKPYLRYRNPKNRIIAMPAFLGGEFNKSGIKWIASFPDNIHMNLPRAHSVVILNNAETGQPEAVINTALLSIIRTASVSGLMLKYFDEVRHLDKFKLGIVGFGPIGQYHLKMVTELFGDRIDRIVLYDLRPIDLEAIDCPYKDKMLIADDWRQAYEDADVFITCTVSATRYIDMKPKNGSLLLNVSLRDYKTEIFNYVKNTIVVDDWEEVCREKTDVEFMYKEKGLRKEDTQSIVDIVCNNGMNQYSSEDVIMFNPMGMSIFDIAIASYYVDKAIQFKVGQYLED